MELNLQMKIFAYKMKIDKKNGNSKNRIIKLLNFSLQTECMSSPDTSREQ